MNGLDVAIRAKLDAAVEQMRQNDDDLPGFTALCDATATIEAVLDLHALMGNPGPWRWCRHCCDSMGEPVNYPCPTVRTIAEKLGVEVGG